MAELFSRMIHPEVFGAPAEAEYGPLGQSDAASLDPVLYHPTIDKIP
jgi:hypothetical protein